MSNDSELSAQMAARHAEIVGTAPRIAPLDRKSVEKVVQQDVGRLLGRISGPDCELPEIPLEAIPEIMFTLCRFPELWGPLMDMTIPIQGPSARLPPRDRKLAILRTGWLCQAPYEFGEHVSQARKIGFTSDEIERIISGSSAPEWDAHERAVLLAVEELHTNTMVSDATWEQLAKRFDEGQLFELLVLIGQFTATAYFQNALRLRLEANNKGLAAR